MGVEMLPSRTCDKTPRYRWRLIARMTVLTQPGRQGSYPALSLPGPGFCGLAPGRVPNRGGVGAVLLAQAGEDGLSAEDIEIFYRLLGGYRGLSEAAIGYAELANGINWAQWRQARF